MIVAKKAKRNKKLGFVIVGMLVCIAYCFAQNNWIEIDYLKIELNNLPLELSGLKIAHVSDVHLPKNASTLEKLIEKVNRQNPDIIVITGDIIDRSTDITTSELARLAKGLSRITTTFTVTGNHEFDNGHVGEWKRVSTRNGVIVLDNKIYIYEKNGESVAFIGLQDGYEYCPGNFKDIHLTENMPRILLAHRPELFETYSSHSNSINPHLVFSGHAHGGQFRIPFTGQGIIAPDQGFFPKYTSGIYFSNSVYMVVSRGLGNSIIPIRINNRPHLPTVELRRLN